MAAGGERSETAPPVSATEAARTDLRDRADLLRLILDAVPGGVVHVAVDGSIIEANAEALRILGFRFDALTKRYISDFSPETIHEDGTPFPVEEYPVARVLTTGLPQGPVTLGVRRPDGDLYWAVFRALPARDANGTLTGAIVTFLDITERKRAEELQRRSEMKWRSLAEGTPDIVMIADREARIESISRLLPGYEMEKVVGSLAYAYIHPDYVADWRARFDEALETGKVVRCDTRMADDAMNQTHWFETIFVPLLEGERVERVLYVSRDVTDRRAMIATLAEKERLASVGMLAASVAHEIMNPLTYVLANLDFATGTRCDSEERRMRALAEAREGAARMQQIVWDLRSLGRAGAQELFYVDVRSVLETALRLSGPEVSRNVEVKADLAEVPGVFASESRLCQVFINLLVNAAQATEGRPREERVVHICTKTNAEETLVAVEVRDNGMGIAPHELGKVFDPFFTTKRSGTGLGLSISRDCIERMGGRIEVESTAGAGTTFTVWLSTQRVMPARPQPTSR